MEQSAYLKIAEKLDRGAMGVPRVDADFSPAFIEYLKTVYHQEEAELVQHLDMPRELLPATLDIESYQTAGEVAERAGVEVSKARKTLNRLAGSNLVTSTGTIFKGRPTRVAMRMLHSLRTMFQGNGIGWIMKNALRLAGKPLYALPYIPMLINAHHFREKEEPGDRKVSDQYQEFFIQDGFYKNYEGSQAGTPGLRTIPVMASIETGQTLLEHERAKNIITSSSCITLTPCPCRTRAERLGTRECRDRNPIGTCIMLGLPALHFEATGQGRRVNAKQALRYLGEMQDLGLVATTDNYIGNPHTIICLCCECCCSQTRGRTRWDNPSAIAPSNFLPVASGECMQCGTCSERCFFEAIQLDQESGRAKADRHKCIGCGLCAATCPSEALKLHRIQRSEDIQDARALYARYEAERR